MAFDLTQPTFWKRFLRLSFGVWNPDIGQQTPLPGIGSTNTGAAISDERALQVAAVFSAIRLIAETCASLPLAVYKRLPDGTRVSADDHWLSKLLDEPNALMTGQEFREALMMQIVGWGNGYCAKVSNDTGKVIELWPLRPDGMKVTRTAIDVLEYQYSGSQGKITKYGMGEILHVKGLSTDGIMGISPLGIGRQALGLAIAAEDYAGSFFRSGGKPSGVLMVDKVLKPEQESALEKKYGGMADGGDQNGNKLWVLQSFAKYQPITIPPEDAQMLATRQMSIAEIARLFRVPLFLLMEGGKDSNFGTGLEQQNLGFLTYTLRAYLSRVEQSFNRWILPPQDRKNYYVEHNVEGLLRADSAARANLYSQLAQNGVMTRNEIRMKENLPRQDGGDALTVQTNLVPLGQLGAAQAVNPIDAATVKWLENA